MSESRTHFRLCSSCKKELPFGAPYYVCSVSTCNRKRTGLSFCSVPCFEAHVPLVRHREAWAEERRTPTEAEYARQRQEEADKEAARSERRERDAVRRVVGGDADGPREVQFSDDAPQDILVVVSKLKAYVRARSGLRTSDTLMDPLSDIIRQVVDDAIEKAAADGRNTVMDRDL